VYLGDLWAVLGGWAFLVPLVSWWFIFGWVGGSVSPSVSLCLCGDSGVRLEQLAGGVVEIVEVESDEGKLRAIVGCAEGVGAADLLAPVSGQTR
jgi:hypothetical protein